MRGNTTDNCGINRWISVLHEWRRLFIQGRKMSYLSVPEWGPCRAPCLGWTARWSSYSRDFVLACEEYWMVRNEEKTEWFCQEAPAKLAMKTRQQFSIQERSWQKISVAWFLIGPPSRAFFGSHAHLIGYKVSGPHLCPHFSTAVFRLLIGLFLLSSGANSIFCLEFQESQLLYEHIRIASPLRRSRYCAGGAQFNVNTIAHHRINHRMKKKLIFLKKNFCIENSFLKNKSSKKTDFVIGKKTGLTNLCRVYWM